MSSATSVVGSWNGFVDWGCNGGVLGPTPWTFNADGSWTYNFGGGRWFQVEGLVVWNFTYGTGLIYTANVTRNAMVGIMGYAVSGSSPGTGCFYAVRQEAGAGAAAAPPAKRHDIMLGPKKK